MTWYEWGYYAIKLHDITKKEQHYQDLFLGVTRMMIADFRNAHGVAVNPVEIFRLSFEKEIVQERPLTFKESKALYGSRIKYGKQ